MNSISQLLRSKELPTKRKMKLAMEPSVDDRAVNLCRRQVGLQVKVQA
jgi:hypothetical protein